MHSTFKIFHEGELKNYLNDNNKKIKENILNKAEDYILNVNENEYIESLVNKFRIDPIKLNFEEISHTKGEKNLPGSYFPQKILMDGNKTYKTPTIIFHIPFTGNRKLLSLRPNPWINWTYEVFISDNSVCFEILNTNNNHEEIKKELSNIIKNMKDLCEKSYKQIQKYNQDIHDILKSTFESRKKSLISENKCLSSLEIPIKKNNHVETYAVDPPKLKEKLKIKSEPSFNKAAPIQLDPTLDNSTYDEIIEIIREICKPFENYPHNMLKRVKNT